MKIGIVGAGYIGRALAKLASDHGVQAMISNSRGPDTLASVAMATRSKAGTIDDAIAFGDIVAIAIPFNNRDKLSGPAFAGKVVIDANNYYPHRDGTIRELDERRTTTSQMIAALLPHARVVKAFNAILATDLERDGQPAGTPGRRALPIAGDDPDAKRLVAEFQDRVGFDVIDAGGLADSWRFERAKPGYCIPLDAAGMRQALAAAERDVEMEEGAWRPKPRTPSTAAAETPALVPAATPDWLLAFYRELDMKRFGAGLDFFQPDAELRLGTRRAMGIDQIGRALLGLADGSDASHEIAEFLDGGTVKVVRGEVVTPGKAANPAFVHLWFMAGEAPPKVRLLYGAAGSVAT